ncbi:MAG: purine-nucleoside phosphorylase [Candidatus Baltobacteraceae bacterium]
MNPKKLAQAAARLQRRAGGAIEAAVVLGSGLSPAVRGRIDGVEVPYEKLHAPAALVDGHPGVAHAGTWCGKRVVAFAGRVHRYQGYSPEDVTYLVRLAAAAGAKTLVLTNAAGALNEEYAAGDLMLIADHLNLTGATPLDGSLGNPFLNMVDAYAPRLRALAREASDGVPLREGVYAGLPGPAFETPAEALALRRLGADAAGMSTVLETIAARALGLEVLGVSAITNVIGPAHHPSSQDVLAVAERCSEPLARLIGAVVAGLRRAQPDGG